MEKCKFCQAELAENGTFCPSCGRNNGEELPAEEIATEVPSVEEPAVEETVAEESVHDEMTEPEAQTPPAEEKKVTPGKLALAIAAVAVLIAVLIAMIVPGMTKKAEESPEVSEPAAVEEMAPATVPADGNPDDITCKGTYTVTDEEAEATQNDVVATIGEHQLTNAQLRIYYRSAMSSFLNTEYGYYMMMYGMLDPNKPLDTQMSMEDNMTWQQFFLDNAMDNWQLTQGMAVEAEKAGMVMEQVDKDYMTGLRASLEKTAEENGMKVEDMLRSDFGMGVTYDAFAAYQELYLQGIPYYEAEVSKLVPTEADLETYFAAHEEEFASSGVSVESKYVDVRHILVKVEGGTADEAGNVTYTDEEWAACEADAQAILDQWLAGDKTEDSFAQLANEKSEDSGSNTAGGLYENVYQGQMVAPFEEWCFDASRQYGDYGLVRTNYGYHVMFYVASRPMWKTFAESGWINEKTAAFMDTVAENYPMEVTFEKITLGNMTLA